MNTPSHDVAWINAQVFEHLNLGVNIWHIGVPGDPTSIRLVRMNPAAERLTGRRAVDYAGGLLLDIHPSKNAAAIAARFLEVAATQRPVYLTDQRFKIEHRELMWLRVRVLPLSDRYIATVYSNVADQIDAAHNLALRTEALERSNRELEEFAGAVSHDLREPLRKVVAFGGRLNQGAKGSLDARSQDYLQRMVGAATRMQHLIDDLLTLSRVRAMGRPFVETPMDTIVAGVLDDLEVLIEQTGGSVTVGPLPKVRCDPTQVRQLVQNLVGNALKFHKPGEPPKVRIEELPGRKAGVVGFVVTDAGIGFEPRFANQIFGVFQRLHGRTAYEGSGVGLAVCKRIVERHGGQIVASSAPETGTRFEVYLPAATSAAVDA